MLQHIGDSQPVSSRYESFLCAQNPPRADDIHRHATKNAQSKRVTSSLAGNHQVFPTSDLIAACNLNAC